MSIPLDYSVNPNEVSFGGDSLFGNGSDSLFGGSTAGSESQGVLDWFGQLTQLGVGAYGAVTQIRNSSSQTPDVNESQTENMTRPRAVAGVSSSALVLGGLLLAAVVVGVVLLKK